MQVVTFKLNGITEDEYREGCEQDASAWAQLAGLVSKVWIADGKTGTYGGIYTWRSRDDYEAYIHSDLFKAMESDPTLAELISRDFHVLEGPTAVTHGLIEPQG